MPRPPRLQYSGAIYHLVTRGDLMREVALGRKNWLFVGNVEAGERSARLMSIVSSAKRNQLDVGL